MMIEGFCGSPQKGLLRAKGDRGLLFRGDFCGNQARDEEKNDAQSDEKECSERRERRNRGNSDHFPDQQVDCPVQKARDENGNAARKSA